MCRFSEVWRHRNLVAYHVLVWGYAVISTICMLLLGLNGRAGDWCWTTSNDMKLVVYSVLWLSFLLIVVCSILIVWRTAKVLYGSGATTEDEQQKLKRIRGRYPRSPILALYSSVCFNP